MVTNSFVGLSLLNQLVSKQRQREGVQANLIHPGSSLDHLLSSDGVLTPTVEQGLEEDSPL